VFPAPARICAAAFTFAFANVMVATVTPFYAYDQLGGGAGLSAIFGVVQSLGYTLTSLIAVRFLARTRHGLRWPLYGIVFSIASSGSMPFINSVWLCIAVSTVALCAQALSWPAMHAWIGATHEPATRARNMSWFNLSWSSGAALGPLLAGPLYDADYRLPFAGMALFATIAWCLVRSMPLEKDHFGEATTELLEARAGHDRAAEIYLHAAWVGVLVFNALAGVLRMVFPKRVDDLVDSGGLHWLFETTPSALLSNNAATIFSVLMFANSAATALAFAFMGRTQFWKHRYIWIVLPQLLCTVAFLATGVTHSVIVMFFCIAAVGWGLGMCFFQSTYYNMANPALKHRRASINEGMVGSGALIGSGAFGYVTSAYGMSAAFICTPVFVVAAVLTGFALYRRRRALFGS